MSVQEARPEMTLRAAEETQIHTRLMKCPLVIEDTRSYWERVAVGAKITSQEAFAGCWFGSRSLSYVAVLLTNFRARFEAYPNALSVLSHWSPMSAETRQVLCHWHLQLSDPLYRAFTGSFLAKRLQNGRAPLHLDAVLSWVETQTPSRWSQATRKQICQKLMFAAASAGMLGPLKQGRRALYLPTVSGEALAYMLYLLKETQFIGSLEENPYFASLGLWGGVLEDRLRQLTEIRLSRNGEFLEISWKYESLTDWAAQKGFTP